MCEHFLACIALFDSSLFGCRVYDHENNVQLQQPLEQDKPECSAQKAIPLPSDPKHDRYDEHTHGETGKDRRHELLVARGKWQCQRREIRMCDKLGSREKPGEHPAKKQGDSDGCRKYDGGKALDSPIHHSSLNVCLESFGALASNTSPRLC